MVPLGEVTKPITTWTPSSVPDCWFTYVDLASVDNQTKIISRGSRIQGEAAPSRARQLVQSRDVLVSTVRPNLNAVATVDEQFDGATVSTGFTVLRPSNLIDGRYLFHWVRSQRFIADMVNKATGASYPAVSDRTVKESTVPLPRLDEQRRIAAILDQADRLRTGRLQATALLHSLGRSMFRDTFGEFSDPTPRWPIVEFGDVISEGPQNGLYKPAKDYGAGTPIARIDSYQDGLPIEPARLKRVRISESEAKLYALSTGDIVINRVNARTHLGKATMVRGLIETTVFESNMMRIRLDTRRAQSEYIIAAFGTQYMKRQIQAAAKDAVNQSSINQKDVMGFKIPLPPMDQQSRYIRRRERLQQVHLLQKRSVTDLDELFAALQARAFRGEL